RVLEWVIPGSGVEDTPPPTASGQEARGHDHAIARLQRRIRVGLGIPPDCIGIDAHAYLWLARALAVRLGVRVAVRLAVRCLRSVFAEARDAARRGEVREAPPPPTPCCHGATLRAPIGH